MRRSRWGMMTVAAGALAVSQTGAVATADAQQPTEVSGEFTALTYNVAGLPAALSGSEPDVNTVLISPLLNAYDLVLVQESWANNPPLPGGLEVYHEVLVSQVTHPFLSEPAPLPLGTDPRRPEAFVSDGLNRMSRFPFGELTRVMWDGCFGGIDTSDGGAGDCLSQKGFSVATTTLAPGVEVDVYNLHGEAGGTAEDERLSRLDYEQLAAFMVTHSAGKAVIVGGDFNLRPNRQPDGEVLATFREETGLTDVCEVVDCGDDANEIDRFMFRSGGGVTIEALAHSFERDRFRRDDGEPLSDHDALAVTFAWSAVVEGDKPPTPARPAEPAKPATPARPATPANPAEPATPANPAEPATPRFTG